MFQDNAPHYEREQSIMILALESDFEVLGMDENEYHEASMLLTPFDDDGKHEAKPNDCCSSVLAERSSSIQVDDDEDFLDADSVDEIVSSNVSSRTVVKESSESKKPSPQNVVRDYKEADGAPGEFDVLCGQSRACANHDGNRRFQVILEEFAPKYDAVTSKQEKMMLTKEIVARVRECGGRFMKSKGGQCWQEISNVTARDKVSHALRTKVASWKRQQEQGASERSACPAPPTCDKQTPTQRRRRSGGNSPRRRSSASSRHSPSSINTCSSDIVTSSFDGSDPASSSLMEGLLKSQREIFANLQKDSVKRKEGEAHPFTHINR